MCRVLSANQNELFQCPHSGPNASAAARPLPARGHPEAPGSCVLRSFRRVMDQQNIATGISTREKKKKSACEGFCYSFFLLHEGAYLCASCIILHF